MHNIIVEDERDKDGEANEVIRYDDVGEEVRPSRAPTHELQEFLQVHRAIKDGNSLSTSRRSNGAPLAT
jgi:hypothetical protein